MKYCKKCGKEVSRNCKLGYCRQCRNITGKNNPFYGKTHSIEAIEKIRIVNIKISKEHWTNIEYRKNVINKMTGLKRSDKFKTIQRKNAIKQFKDPSQRAIRSKTMKESWQKGKINKNNFSCNSSKQEKLYYKEVLKIFPDAQENQTLHSKSGKWYYPDILIEQNKLIIEYNGDFWHANPSKYNKDDVIIDNITAKEIWKKDKERIRILEDEIGYSVFVIWEEDFKKDKEYMLNYLYNLHEWESCSL